MLATDMLPNQICSVLLEWIIVVKNNQTTKEKHTPEVSLLKCIYNNSEIGLKFHL